MVYAMHSRNNLARSQNVHLTRDKDGEQAGWEGTAITFRFVQAGQGIVAEVDGQAIAVGNARLLAERVADHNLQLVATTEAEWSSQGA